MITATLDGYVPTADPLLTTKANANIAVAMMSVQSNEMLHRALGIARDPTKSEVAFVTQTADGVPVGTNGRLEVWNHGVIRVSVPADVNAQYAFTR